MGKLLDIIDKHDCYGCESNWDLEASRKTDDEIVDEVKKLIKTQLRHIYTALEAEKIALDMEDIDDDPAVVYEKMGLSTAQKLVDLEMKKVDEL